ncbi:exopolysaccharide biosynthesis protein [Roseomonas sp. OT10]|uniref:exopolysaccharide biosynthesis protein n=1 Tax=Roseomonas cutis TaxID=2897332 RepID=UPI001E5349FB|nr:exopolysaccharide biosynthesis protein [Roseomonas sp. OT10]UFN46990.1 exopolysaccharide biosynthesis protein [Roseomonas sp. OT10]
MASPSTDGLARTPPDQTIPAPPSPPPPPGAADTGHDPAHGSRAPISRIVAEVAAACPGERITLGQMAEIFGDRAFGLLILLLCLPAMLPAMATVFGLPILLLGVQMGLGWRSPHLPGFMARQSIRRVDLLRLSHSGSRWLGKIERFVRPRPGPFNSPMADRVVGWLTVCTAILLILPGPGTNGPPAFGNIVMALGVVEQDNRVIGLGMLLTLLGVLVGTAMLVAMGWVGLQGASYVLGY